MMHGNNHMIAENTPSSTLSLILSFLITATRPQTSSEQFGMISQRALDRLNDLPGSAIRVYIALANYANRRGYAWPGRKRLAALDLPGAPGPACAGACASAAGTDCGLSSAVPAC